MFRVLEQEFKAHGESHAAPLQEDQTFPTGWAGERTYEQIINDMRHYLMRNLRRMFRDHEDVEDCLQIGYTRLWMWLMKDHHLLAELSLSRACARVSSHSLMQTQAYTNDHKIPVSRLNHEDFGVSDEETLTYYHNRRLESVTRHAGWATQVDMRLDLTYAIRTVAEEYRDNFKALVALYILTTHVAGSPTAHGMGLTYNQVRRYNHALRDRLQSLLEDYAPRQQTWESYLNSGHFAPYLQVVEAYQHKPNALKALYTLTTGVTVKSICEPQEVASILNYRQRLRKQLEAAYQRAASV